MIALYQMRGNTEMSESFEARLVKYSSKDVYLLILGIYEYVNFHGKSTSAVMIKLRTLKWEDYPGLPRSIQCNLSVFIYRKGYVWTERESERNLKMLRFWF